VLELPPLVLTAGILWGLAGLFCLSVVLRRWRTRHQEPQPNRYPAALVSGILLLAWAPVVSAVQIVAIVAVYGYYGVRLWGVPLTPIRATATLIGMTILMILIGIASHILIAVRTRPERADERDEVVELRGARNAYRALAAGLWCVLLLFLAHSFLGLPSQGLLFYAIMAAFALAELVRLGSQLLYYRLGT